MNITIIKGNLTAAPELTFTPSGTAVCDFRIANNRVFRNSTDELMEETSYFNVKTFGKQAENHAEHLLRGSQVTVTGRLKSEEWDDKQTGQKRSRILIIADQVDYGFKPKSAQAPAQNQPVQEQPRNNRSNTPPAAKGNSKQRPYRMPARTTANA